MTETIEAAQILEAVEMIDRGLARLQNRELVASSEVADLLLDVRTLLAAIPDEAASN